MQNNKNLYIFKSKKNNDTLYNVQGYDYNLSDIKIILNVFKGKYQGTISDYNKGKNFSITQILEIYAYLQEHKFLILLDKDILDFYIKYKNVSKLSSELCNSTDLPEKSLKYFETLDRIVKIVKKEPVFPSTYKNKKEMITYIFNYTKKFYRFLQDLLKPQYFIYYCRDLRNVTIINNIQKFIRSKFQEIICNPELLPYAEILEEAYKQKISQYNQIISSDKYAPLMEHIHKSFNTISQNEFEVRHYKHHEKEYCSQIDALFKSLIPSPIAYDLEYLKEKYKEYAFLHKVLKSYQYVNFENQIISDFMRRYGLLNNIIQHKEAVKKIIDAHNITSIYHFTQISNLDSIRINGLLSVNELEKRNIAYSRNDEFRLDGLLDGICCSIGFPNYKLFYKFRSTNINKHWVVLEIIPDILLNTEGWKVFSGNAAGSRLEILEYKDLELEKIFTSNHNTNKRDALHIPDGYPTNPQAELIIPKSIPVKYIKSLNFCNEEDLNKYNKLWNIDCLLNKSLFSKRLDWKYWENIEIPK